MARGWESKAVEDQMQATEAAKELRSKPVLTDDEIKRRAQLEELMLSRAKVLKNIETTKNARYKAVLERSLAHLDAEIAKLNSASD